MQSKQTSLPGLRPVAENSKPANAVLEKSTGKESPKPRFQRIDREQVSWRMVDVERLIPDDHPARAIWEFVGNLDLSGYMEQFRAVEGKAGRPALHPQLLISLWIYAYSQGIGSGRAIEHLCTNEAAFQWLTGTEVVNAHSLSDFRVAHEQTLKGLFVQVLALLRADGLITLERVMQDGTKIRASAASDTFRSGEGIEKALQEAREQIEAVDKLSEEESSKRASKARERARRERKERLQSALDTFKKLQAQDVRVSLTDPEARVMKQPNGGFAPSYNVQLNTDASNGMIVAVDVTQAGNDFEQLMPGIERVKDNFGQTPRQVVADGGYVSRDNIVEMQSQGVQFIGPQCDDSGKSKGSYQSRGVSAEFQASKFVYDEATNSFRCPRGKTLHYERKDVRNSQVLYRYRTSAATCQACVDKGQCCPGNRNTGRSIQRSEDLPEVLDFNRKMQTEEARMIYKQRAQIAETPNLWIKAKFGLRQFSVRGLRKVKMEAIWVSLTYNLSQWIRLRWKKEIVAPAAG
jgi:transposase